MKIFKTVEEWNLERHSLQGTPINFVPTMGALHSGHLSLVKHAKRSQGYVVVSIFVNPTQFNNSEDFEKYPSTIQQDIALLQQEKCHALFLPSIQEVYPNGTAIQQPIDFGFLARTLEGEFRPGHFAGMAQVVERLLQIIQPQKLFMGLKDYQQALIVEELIKRRNLNVELIKCATKREADGLAMSSRNVRLDKNAREVAVQLSKTLFYIKRKIQMLRKANNPEPLQSVMEKAKLKLAEFSEIHLEYLEVRNAKTLQPVSNISERELVALVAANIGGVRLIDNVLIP
jgi:pantoate--beta-alanine ligase